MSRNASATVTRTLRDLQEQTHSAVEHSKQTAAAAVSEMLETHGMLRSDTTALFERLREANILLQEVLSGAHENMGEIERTLVARVSDFVAAMNEVTQKTGAANAQVEQHIASFQSLTTKTVTDLAQLAGQFDVHGRSLAEAVTLVDQSNRRAEGSLSDRRESLETLVETLDSKSRRSRSAAHALLQPARSVAGRRGGTGARDRPHHRRIRPPAERARSPRTSRPSARAPRSRASSPPTRCAASTNARPEIRTRCSPRRPSASPTSSTGSSA